MDVNSVNNGSLSGQQVTSQKKLTETYDNFLKLLTTQLQYQDPLNPMDSKDFTNQLVSFSGVEQQIRSNQTLTDIQSALTANQTQTALSFIGLDTLYTGANFNYDGTTQAVTYNLPEQAKQVAISIKDAEGNVVFTKDGETGKGDHAFTWDGTMKDGTKAPKGIYSVAIGAVDSEGMTIADTSTRLNGLVTGIETREDGLYLNFGDLAVPANNVTAARKPAAAAA